MTGGGVSIRYARALLELGIEAGKADKIQEELSAFAQAYGQSKDLQAVLNNPSVELDERKTIVRTLATKYGFQPLTSHFLQLLLDKERVSSLPLIARAYQALADEQAGRVRASVTAARKLSPAQASRMKLMLSKMTGKEVVLETSEDPELLGGVVTRLGGKVYDGSLRRQLEQMKRSVGR